MEESLPLDGNGQLPGSRNRLNDDIGALDAALGQLLLGAVEQRRNDGLVPTRVHDADAQGAAVVLFRLGAFERGRSHTAEFLFYILPVYVSL